MVWLLQLANLHCPCLGLTSNELSCYLLLSRAPLEMLLNFSPQMRDLAVTNRPQDCSLHHSWALGWELPRCLWDWELGQKEGWGSGSGRQSWPKWFKTCTSTTNSSVPLAAFSGLLKPSTPPPVAFLFLLQHHSGVGSFSLLPLTEISWKSWEREAMVQTHNPSELVGRGGWGKATQTSFKIRYLALWFIFIKSL